MAGYWKIHLLFIFFCFHIHTFSQTVYIKAGQVFDGKELIGSKIITIDCGYITDLIDPQYPFPDTVNVIDASDCTVLPGLIDSHIHFMAAPMPYIAEINKHSFGKLASEGISLFPEHRLHLLMNGITSIIDMGAPLKSYTRIKEAIRNGKIISPEIFFPGQLITAPNGHPAGTYYTGQHDLIINGTFQVNNINKAKIKVESLINQNVDFIKIVYDSMWYLKDGVPRLDFAIAKEIVKESHRLGLRVIAHVGSSEEAREMIGISVDGIEHGFSYSSDSVFADFKNRNISFTPTLSAYDHYAPMAVPLIKKAIQRASELNVPIITGTDYPSSYGKYCGDDVFKEMNLLEGIGISRIEVLKGATSYGSEKIGKEKEIGHIGKGYRANLILYKGQVDTGRLTSSRIIGTMLHGNMVIEKGILVEEYAPFFKTRNTMIFPYGFYDAVSEYNMGVSHINFDLFRSGISLYSDVSWSTRNMWSVNLQFFIPSPFKKTSLKAIFHFDNQNRLYYGIGNNTLPESEIEYGSVCYKENISATTTWNKYWKLDCSFTLEQFKTNTKQDVIPLTINGVNGGNQTILGLSFIYDSRDHQNNPWKGTMISLTSEFSPKFLGSTYQFERLTFDVRGYISIFPRNIFCARFLYRQALGDIPYYYLPDFGGSTLGRGYYTSRFMDRTGLYGQAEYRFPIVKIISCVAFYDIGQVQKNAKAFTINGFHHNIGFGPRFCFGSNENSVLGMDFGYSPEGMLVLFHAGHAF